MPEKVLLKLEERKCQALVGIRTQHRLFQLSVSGIVHGCRSYSSKVDYFSPGVQQVKVWVGKTYDDVVQPKSERPPRAVQEDPDGKSTLLNSFRGATRKVLTRKVLTRKVLILKIGVREWC